MEAWNKFIRSNPTWRGTLRQAVTAKLEIVEGQAREVEARVREELSDETFTDYDVMQHPRLKRRRAEVSLWTGLLAACDDPRDAQGVWTRVIQNLPLLRHGESRAAGGSGN